MKVYPGLKNQTFIRIPRSGLVQKYLIFTEEGGEERIYHLEFGYWPVRLPEKKVGD